MRSLLVFILLHTFFVSAQSGRHVYFHLEKITLKEKFPSDSSMLQTRIQNAYSAFAMNGYTGLSIKDSTVEKNNLHYYFEAEKRFKKIILINETDTLKSKSFSSNQDYFGVIKSLDEVLKKLENNGYPFAAINISDQREEKNQLILNYKIDSGDFFIVDEIVIKSKSKFHENTILNIININPGDFYNESKIIQIQELFRISGLYKLMRPVEILFLPGKAKLYLYIEKENASDADGFVGFQQDKTTERLVLNGFFNLQLNNSFNRAEQLHVNWKNNPDKTQNLRLKFEYPYLLNTPLSIGTRINLQKQDTSFVRSDAYFETAYLQNFFRYGVFYQLESSNTILQNVPDFLRDYRKNTVGLNLRYRPLFTGSASFYKPVFFASGGFFNYRADSVDVNTNNGSNKKYELRYEHSIRFLKYFFLNNSISYEGLTANTNMSANELIFFGGLRSLRGFYELELTGNDVVIINNEIEFSPSEVLSFKILYDFAKYNYNMVNYAHAAGFGFGLAAGSVKLEIIIANGWFQTNGPQLSNTKVHLGFKSYF